MTVRVASFVLSVMFGVGCADERSAAQTGAQHDEAKAVTATSEPVGARGQGVATGMKGASTSWEEVPQAPGLVAVPSVPAGTFAVVVEKSAEQPSADPAPAEPPESKPTFLPMPKPNAPSPDVPEPMKLEIDAPKPPPEEATVQLRALGWADKSAQKNFKENQDERVAAAFQERTREAAAAAAEAETSRSTTAIDIQARLDTAQVVVDGKKAVLHSLDKEGDKFVDQDGELDEAANGLDNGDTGGELDGKDQNARATGKTEGGRTTRPNPPPPPQRPATFLPNTFYFENTYLGGDAGYREALRQLDSALAETGAPHRLASLPPQAFDAPEHGGLAVTATLDRVSMEEAGRVFLQVGIRGSDRYGWRRPPLELAVVVDGNGPGRAASIALVEALISKLGVQDRLAVVDTGREDPVAPLEGIRRHRADLMPQLEGALRGGGDVGAAMRRAGALLRDASEHRTTAPGTQVILVLTTDPLATANAVGIASELGLQGMVTSVIGLGSEASVAACWGVAAAGHGNLHAAASATDIPAAVDAELELLARVVARLVRVNIRLAPGVKVSRVLGSRPLGLDEVRVVKAREVETDRRLSNVLGIASDRGDDDDGIQTVIPVFYGGDSHIIALELWVEGPGSVADVSLKYKDLVHLDNATARTSVSLRSGTRGLSADQTELARNLAVLEGSEALARAATALDGGDTTTARAELLALPAGGPRGQYGALLDRVNRGEVNPGTVAESLRLASRRSAGGGG